MPLYLLRCSLSHVSFRVPNLLSVAQTYGINMRFVSEDLERGAIVVELDSEDDAQRFLDRGMQVMWAAELYANAGSYEELHSKLQVRQPEIFEKYKDSVFKITVEGLHLHIPGSRQASIAGSFEYLDLKGRIDLTNPEINFIVLEDYDWQSANTKKERIDRQGQFHQVYFGRMIGPTRMRNLVNKYSVKTREYYGNTSMEAEMGFLMACQTLASPGKVIYDPFVGTGSLLYACAHFGAMVLGSDIDGRQMRGKQRGKGVRPGIYRAAAQYGVESNVLGCLTFDVTRHPLRRGGWLDAIITDPPYGVRAGAKRLGKKEEKGRPLAESAHVMEDGTYAHENPTYLPPSRPYELAHLTLDLIRFARYMLVPKGRLVFFLPTVTEEYDAIDIPVVEGMRELKVGEGSVQEFGPWGRRLITMEKTAEDDGPVPTFSDYTQLEEHTPAHTGFNKRYAEGFKSKAQD